MSNTTPDFSLDPERMALAKAMLTATVPDADWSDPLYSATRTRLLIYADVAITHLGSGYRLPEVTEANAERLARAAWAVQCAPMRKPAKWESMDFVAKDGRMLTARMHLRALHAAFGEQEKPAPSRYDFCQCQHQRQTHDGLACGAFGCDCKGFTSRVEKPEPVFAGTTTPQPQCTCNSGIRQVCYAQHHVTDTCTATSGDYHCELPTGHGGEHSAGRIAWEEEAGEEPLKEDFAAQAAEIERKRLVEAFMRDMVSNPAVMAKMLENYEADEDAIAARLHEIALAFAQELIG